MHWSRRHPHEAWIGSVLLIALLFIGVRDTGMSAASTVAVMITIACALALIVGDLLVVLIHHRRRPAPSA